MTRNISKNPVLEADVRDCPIAIIDSSAHKLLDQPDWCSDPDADDDESVPACFMDECLGFDEEGDDDDDD